MTKKLLSPVFVFAAASMLLPSESYANSYNNQTIGQVQVDSRPCVFFWLTGVPLADPAVPGQGWFALPKSAGNYQEMVSELLSSKLTGKPVYVWTDGTISCGFATAVQVGLDY